MSEVDAVLAASLLGLILAEDAIAFIAHPAVPRPLLSLKGSFNFNALSDGDCRFNFRFWKTDMIRLHKALSLEEDYKLPSRVRVGGMEGLCIMLRRLAYPGRYGDLAVMFGRSPTALCLIFRYMVDLIHTKYGGLVALECGLLDASRCAVYARAVAARGSPITRCIGFIDGTRVAVMTSIFYVKAISFSASVLFTETLSASTVIRRIRIGRHYKWGTRARGFRETKKPLTVP
ncbi:hypothetical protein PF010_g31226 [Phytophthora fragariae]|uniref:DDE Tnp4 domain-containing protein n=2 Tax=Phytophthora TaxID=4783 RepID=A0A6G0JI58_9STRA|nr:hypothetical protein PF010_g31226 [Phytophthora fragariae]